MADDKPKRAPVPVPRGLTVDKLEVGIEELAVFSFPDGFPALVRQLTHAQRDVLAKVLAGASNREIAEARGTAERTVANQVASLFRHFGVRSRAQLVQKVMQENQR